MVLRAEKVVFVTVAESGSGGFALRLSIGDRYAECVELESKS